MALVCPSCGSGEISPVGVSVETADQKYHCKKCGYTGPLAIETEEGAGDESRGDFPYMVVAALAFISAAAFGLGASIISCALFFSIPTALLLGFHFFVKEEDSGGVEKDLENLGEDGKLKG